MSKAYKRMSPGLQFLSLRTIRQAIKSVHTPILPLSKPRHSIPREEMSELSLNRCGAISCSRRPITQILVCTSTVAAETCVLPAGEALIPEIWRFSHLVLAVSRQSTASN